MKKIFLIALALCFNVANSHAANITPQQIYGFAKSKNYSLLKRSMANIDVTDKNGNTAYCIALQNNDKNAADLLAHYGANKKADCTKNIGMASGDSANKTSSTFLGMGTTGWGVTGAVVAGGVIAAAASGGGGGGSSDGGSSSDDNPARLNCVHGTQQGDICVCQTGYTGTLCDSVADGYIEIGGNIYQKLDCQNGGTQTGETCSCPTGWTGNTCENAAACDYYTTTCDYGYKETGNTCTSGYNIYKECVFDDVNFVKIGGNIYHKLDCQNGGTQTGETCSCPDGWSGDTCATANSCAGYETNCANGYHKTTDTCLSGTTTMYKCAPDICPDGYGKDGSGNCVLKKSDIIGSDIKNSEYADVYGSKDHKNNDIINLDNNSDGNIYGVYGYDGYNIFTDLRDISGKINIINKGYGEIYGVHSTVNRNNINNAYNVEVREDWQNPTIPVEGTTDTSPNKIIASGDIVIQNHGAGNIHGIYSETGLAINAQATTSTYSLYDTFATANIKIDNTGNGEIYGLSGIGTINAKSMDVSRIDSGYEKHQANSNGNIDITNIGNGNVYGMYAVDGNATLTADNKIYNAYATNLSNATGSLNINNKGNGSVWGIYGRADTFNSYTTPQSTTYPNNYSPIAKGIINIESENSNDVTGLSSLAKAYNSYAGANVLTDAKSNAEIKISSKNSNNIYGLKASNDIYNVFADIYLNRTAKVTIGSTGKIDITSSNDKNVYGIYGDSIIYNSYAVINMYRSSESATNLSQTTTTTNGVINISSENSGTVYGIKGNGTVYNAYGIANNYSSWSSLYPSYANTFSYANISIKNIGDNDVYGIFATDKIYNAYAELYATPSEQPYTSSAHANVHPSGTVKIINSGTGKAYGLYSVSGDIYNSDETNANGRITLVNNNDGTSIGIYGTKGIVNSMKDYITIHNLADGVAVGIYGDGGTIENAGSIVITRSDFVDGDTTYSAKSAKGGTAIGIYGASGSTIKNTGTITIDGADNAYGIWAEDSTVSVSNTGTITIDGDSSSANAIKLNGGKLFQDGVLASNSSLNLSDINGLVLATQNSKFVAKDSISGNLLMSSEIVNNGFDTTYTTKDTISSADVSGLNLQSQSALFDAKLAENGSDVTLTMKSFDEVVGNKSLAAFLAQNYREQNGESLFNNIKSAETVSSLNSSLNNFAGQDLFSRMAFEDFTMLRELNFDMNEQMFSGAKNEYFSISGNTAPFAFDNNNGSNSKWSLTGKKSGDTTYALGFAFTDVYSNGADNQNRRADRMFNISAPVGYKLGGLNMVSTPRFGYAYGTYNRKGFNNRDYKGTLSKQMFGFMNEARLPFKAAGWTLAPSAELNLVNYRTEGAEADNLPYALRIKEQNNYSLEAGLGLHAGKQVNFDEQSALSFNLSAAVYHEFGNPYETKVMVNGMSGSFAVKDENRGANRAALRSGFEFTRGGAKLSGSLMSYFDRSLNSKASLDLKYAF